MKKFDSINVIPFIDIMLVLLAIVLTTASFVTNGELDVRVPASSAQPPAEQLDAIEIAIDESHQYFLDGELSSLADIESRLLEVEPATAIRLRVDEVSEFQFFVAVIDVLKQSSLDNVSILTRATD